MRDLAAVAALTLGSGHEGRAIGLTGPAELELDALAVVFTEVLGREVFYRSRLLPSFIGHALRRGVSPPLAAKMTSIGLVVRLGLAKGVDPGVEKVTGGHRHYSGASSPIIARSGSSRR